MESAVISSEEHDLLEALLSLCLHPPEAAHHMNGCHLLSDKNCCVPEGALLTPVSGLRLAHRLEQSWCS